MKLILQEMLTTFCLCMCILRIIYNNVLPQSIRITFIIFTPKLLKQRDSHNVSVHFGLLARPKANRPLLRLVCLQDL